MTYGTSPGTPRDRPDSNGGSPDGNGQSERGLPANNDVSSGAPPPEAPPTGGGDLEERLVAQIGQANILEAAGETDAARRLYESAAAADPEGAIGNSARLALADLDAADPVAEEPAVEAIATELEPRRGWFGNLPIASKQLLTLGASEAISLSLVVVSSVLLYLGLRQQLVQQSRSELEVGEIAYNLKIDQMGFGFRGQSENTAIIAAAASGAELGTVKTILTNEIVSRDIEIATLVDTNAEVVQDANQLELGSRFDPNGLVTRALETGEQVRSTELLAYEELARVSTRFADRRARDLGLDPSANPNFLARYTVTPVRAANSQIVGALISGDVVKLPVAAKVNESFESGYSAVYAIAGDELSLAASQLVRAGDEEATTAPNVVLPSDLDVLQAATEAPGTTQTGRIRLDGNSYAVAARALTDAGGDPVAVLVRGTSAATLNALFQRSLLYLGAFVIVAVLADVLLARFIASRIAGPVRQLRESALAFMAGDRHARARVATGDELGELAESFNEMADSITASEAATREQAELREREADFQRRERERLQQGVIQLLLEIEEAKRGDLTVRARIEEGEMGSVADAFNATIDSLRELVTRVQATSNQVQDSAATSELSVARLSEEATAQADEMTAALSAVEEMAASIQSVANSAQEAAAIARQTREASESGEAAMDRTVSSIDSIRASTAETSKKAKRLTESSQEISKIVSIISGISEKTNLLAFNASIEAARAGEHGQGFRIVADEVRRLAERVTSSTKEIEQLVDTIQVGSAEVLQTMEASTEQVVAGTQLVSHTKQDLQRLSAIGRTMDDLLQSISASTVSQAQTSQQVTRAMQQVSDIAQTTSSESQTVAATLNELVGVAAELQASVARFRLDASPLPDRAVLPDAPPRRLPASAAGEASSAELSV